MRAIAPASTPIPSLEAIAANPIPTRVGRGKKKGKEKERERVVLAFDLSSSCVGWAVGANKRPHFYGKLVFKTTADVGEKLLAFARFFLHLIKVYQPDCVVIEKPLTRRGAVTTRHSEILGVARLLWAEQRGEEIKDSWIISSVTVKSVMQVRRGADHDENKRIMVEKISALYGLKLKWAKSRYDSDDDVADALAVLTTYWRRHSK